MTRDQPAPALIVHDDKAKLVVEGHGAVAGSATLRSTTQASPSQVSCAAGRKKSTESFTQWLQASYRNGAHQLRVRAQVFGAFTAADESARRAGSLITRSER